RRARPETAAESAAEIRAVPPERVRQPAGLSLLEQRDERAVGVSAGGGERRLRTAGAERRIENRQGRLSRQAVVGEAGTAGRRIDLEVPLCVLELRQEPVLEDVHLVAVVGAP